MSDAPKSRDDQASSLVERGHAFLLTKDFHAAEACFVGAIELDDFCAMAHNNLGWTYDCSGRISEAIRCYRRAVEIDPGLTLAKVNLASLTSKTGEYDEALPLWDMLLHDRHFDRQLIHEAIDAALEAGSLHYAAKWAELCAVFTRHIISDYGPDAITLANRDFSPVMLTIESLTHDLEQIKHLLRASVQSLDLEGMAINYEKVIADLRASKETTRRALNDTEQRLIGGTYGRIWYRRPSFDPTSMPLWGEWDPEIVERSYLNSPLGLSVIDDFLSAEALAELRKFCLESTVWFTNRYSHGRLGAFFREGFNSPLLVRLADDFSKLLPRLIGNKHHLLQLWGFKYSANQPATHPHADFAAVNLNFWITTHKANLDENSGGLIVYDVEAPSNWSHDDYNKSGRQISTFLRQRNARAVYIPYRANRAILFNSDLFHATAPVHFRTEYENRRVNITMLFGRRINDAKRQANNLARRLDC
jgi:hypothetical protein